MNFCSVYDAKKEVYAADALGLKQKPRSPKEKKEKKTEEPKISTSQELNYHKTISLPQKAQKQLSSFAGVSRKLTAENTSTMIKTAESFHVNKT